eukprot:COSAG02_NODE_17452_length_1002_cov_1.212625_1_plen_247_part_01
MVVWCIETYKYRTRSLHYSQISDAAWRVKPEEDDQGGSTDVVKAVRKQLATTTYRQRCEAINDALLSDSTFASSNLIYDQDPYCSYCFECLGWFWGETLTDISAVAMTVGMLIFVWGVWMRGWVLDVVVNPRTAGQWFQIGGTIIATGFFLLLLIVSIAKRKFQRALYCPLVSALFVVAYTLSAHGWAFELKFNAFADGSAAQDFSNDENRNLGANDAENIQTVALLAVAAIALTYGCVRGVIMILP